MSAPPIGESTTSTAVSGSIGAGSPSAARSTTSSSDSNGRTAISSRTGTSLADTATGTPEDIRTRRSVLVRPCPRTTTAICDQGTPSSRCALRSSAATSAASWDVARSSATSTRPPGRLSAGSR